MMRMQLKPRSPGSRLGFTLAEALLAATVLAIVAASATLPFAAGVQNTVEAGNLERAVELGESMMEEVLARPFFAVGQTTPTPGPDSGETDRSKYNSIDDFNNFAETQGDVRDYRNQTMPTASADGYRRSVTVEFVTFTNQATGDTNSLAHVQVKVYKNTNLLATLDRLVTRED